MGVKGSVLLNAHRHFRSFAVIAVVAIMFLVIAFVSLTYLQCTISHPNYGYNGPTISFEDALELVGETDVAQNSSFSFVFASATHYIDSDSQLSYFGGYQVRGEADRWRFYFASASNDGGVQLVSTEVHANPGLPNMRFQNITKETFDNLGLAPITLPVLSSKQAYATLTSIPEVRIFVDSTVESEPFLSVMWNYTLRWNETHQTVVWEIGWKTVAIIDAYTGDILETYNRN